MMPPPRSLSAAESPAEAEIAAALRTIWARHQPEIRARAATVERAAEALAHDELSDEQRAEARAAAHRLAGSLGTFGLTTASEHAHRIEGLLARPQPLDESELAALEPLAHAIAAAVAADAQDPPHAIAERRPALPDASPFLLIVEDELPLAESLALEAERADVRSEIVASPADARERLGRARPDAVLLDLTFAGGTAEALDLLSELTEADPPIPVLVSTVRDELLDRVEVARRGGRSFVTKPLPADEVISHVVQLIEQARAAEITVLAVDDDATVLDAVRATLATGGFNVVALADPQRFWQELERVQPDLVLLDIEMPGVSGVELCRVLRNDPRWATVPVLMLTARHDADTIGQVFAAGADDHLAKPLLPAELLVRVRNRVERLRLHRALEETDGLTGIANRHTAAHGLERFIRMAARHQQPLALALLDLDHFKRVNDRHGHAVGDDVLRRLGRLLRQTFRGEDIVGRWGGEEFVIGMYGMDRANAVARLNHLLAIFGEERFAGGGAAFRVGFSAGIACHPRDGTDLDALVEAADAALYRAKSAGRRRVMTTGRGE
jgi:diguanylate cyclase (GGDEF)-like protein